LKAGRFRPGPEKGVVPGPGERTQPVLRPTDLGSTTTHLGVQRPVPDKFLSNSGLVTDATFDGPTFSPPASGAEDRGEEGGLRARADR
jgi:hypothetical protein